MLMPTINLGGKFFNIGVCAFFNTNGLPYNAGDKIKVNCDLKFIYSGGDVTVGSVEIEITVTVAGTYSLVYNFPSLDRGIDTTGFRGAIATITNVNGILGINFEHISIAFNGYSAIEES